MQLNLKDSSYFIHEATKLEKIVMAKQQIENVTLIEDTDMCTTLMSLKLTSVFYELDRQEYC